MSELVRIGSPEWDVLTERRAALIRKKNHEGLSDHEWAEYERLQMGSRASIEAAFPPCVDPTEQGGEPVSGIDIRSLTEAELRGRLWRAVAERDRLRAELAEQKRLNLKLAERLRACSEVLGRASERGRVCGCQQQPRAEGGEG